MLKSWLNFLPDKGFHWSRAPTEPADNSSTRCSFSFRLLFECRSGLLRTRENTRRSSAAFGLGCEPTMTNICCLIGLVNTLCSGRKKEKITSPWNKYTCNFPERLRLMWLLKHQVMQECCWSLLYKHHATNHVSGSFNINLTMKQFYKGSIQNTYNVVGLWGKKRKLFCSSLKEIMLNNVIIRVVDCVRPLWRKSRLFSWFVYIGKWFQ